VPGGIDTISANVPEADLGSTNSPITRVAVPLIATIKSVVEAEAEGKLP
jgi:hypothetical protein